MSGIGPSELVVILLIALMLFGTKRLRTIGSDLGGAIKSFRAALHEGALDTAGRPSSASTGRALTVSHAASSDARAEPAAHAPAEAGSQPKAS